MLYSAAPTSHRRRRIILGAGGGSYANSTFTAASATGSADGTTANTLTLTVYDENGVLMQSAPVTFTTELTAVSASQSTVTGDYTTIPSTTGTLTLTITPKNAAGVALPNIQSARIVVTSTGTGNTIGTPTVTNKYGVSTCTFSSTVAEAKTITVTVDGVAFSTTYALTVSGSGPSIVFAMDYSAGAAEAAGWGMVPTEPAWMTIARVAGIGPSGQDGYRHTWASTTEAQNAQGWRRRMGYGVLGVDGATFGIRMRWRLGAGANGRFTPGSGDNVTLQECRTKFWVINDQYGAGTTGRPIFQFNVRYNGGSPQYRWTQVKGGGDDPINTADTAPPWLDVDTNWHSLQVIYTYSSAPGVADGRYRIYLDGAAEGSPTADSGASIILNATDGGGYADEVALGFYQNNPMMADGVQVLDHCEFAITDGFTSGWTP